MRDSGKGIKEAAAKTKSVIESGADWPKSEPVKRLEELDAKIRACVACPLASIADAGRSWRGKIHRASDDHRGSSGQK